ncbi:MAG: hypothetical protein Kow0069_33680 [Promethearchaeota archaeon]
MVEKLKVVFVGPSAVGKTTLRRVFFEQANPLTLLSHPLEPTFGVETEVYDLGKVVAAVHDLAGQELERWLASDDAFSFADVLVVVLDAREEFTTNETTWKRVEAHWRATCPKAKVIVLFHKVDLLTPKELDALRLRVHAAFSVMQDVRALLTSVAKSLIVETFRQFSDALREAFLGVDRVDARDVCHCAEILTHFVKRDAISLRDLVYSIGGPPGYAVSLLRRLQEREYVTIAGDEVVKLGRKGRYLVENLENLGLRDVLDVVKEAAVVKSVLVANTNGVTMYVYEQDPGLFNQIVERSGKTPKPALVASFISAISMFGQELDEGGISTINLSGTNLQVVSHRYRDVLGVFFLSSLVPAKENVLEILKEFVADFCREFEPEIAIFQNSGAAHPLLRRESQIEGMIRHLNARLQAAALGESYVPTSKVYDAYSRIDELLDDEKARHDLKAMLFHYALTGDRESLDALKRTWEKFGLKEEYFP